MDTESEHPDDIEETIDFVEAQLVLARKDAAEYHVRLYDALSELFRSITGEPAEIYRLDAEFHGSCSRALSKANRVIHEILEYDKQEHEPPPNWCARYQREHKVSYETARKAWAEQANQVCSRCKGTGEVDNDAVDVSDAFPVPCPKCKGLP